jgi:hypothetical protein
MSILHSQLAIYGAIDELVLEARKGKRGAVDQEVLKTAANLVPNSTGIGQAGWYRELEDLFNREGIRSQGRTERLVFPTLDVATRELNEVIPAAISRINSAPARDFDTSDSSVAADRSIGVHRDPSTPGGFEDQTLYDPATDPVLARAGYGAFVFLKLSSIIDWDHDYQPLEQDLKGVLATSVRSFTDVSLDQANGMAEKILEDLQYADTRQDWTANVVENVNSLFAGESKPCFGTLQEIDGRYCSTVVTQTPVPDLSVSDIERIVDPVNWNICSKFFCTMKQRKPNRNASGWSKIRETVGAECAEYGLTTDLIFYKVRQDDGSIFMNYDIDPDREDPGYVKVDNGYLWVTPTTAGGPTAKGALIRTSKQEHVDGLSPCATAALACLMGWADAGKDMIAGTARRLIAGEDLGPLKKFYPSTEYDPQEKDL